MGEFYQGTMDAYSGNTQGVEISPEGMSEAMSEQLAANKSVESTLEATIERTLQEANNMEGDVYETAKTKMANFGKSLDTFITFSRKRVEKDEQNKEDFIHVEDNNVNKLEDLKF